MVRVGVEESLDDALLKGFTKAVELVRVPTAPTHYVDVVFWIAPLRLDTFSRQLPYVRGVKVVQTLQAGVDVFLPLLPAGLRLCDARGVHDIPTAEWTVAAILAMEKYLPLYFGLQVKQDWQGRRSVEQFHRRTHGLASSTIPSFVDEVAGKTVLIVGYGSIGQAVEARLAPFDCKFLRVARTGRHGVESADRLDEFLSEADVVALILPLTLETRHLMNAERIGKMKRGALLVNVGRGPVVDTEALLKALTDDRIRAALDVTDPEPLPAGHPLWNAPNLLITPHVAGASDEFIGRAIKFVSEQADRYARDEPLLNVVSEGY
jgi:phosphoglycerate dehydrogenase-like enzyme